jgi:hypothetical protein
VLGWYRHIPPITTCSPKISTTARPRLLVRDSVLTLTHHGFARHYRNFRTPVEGTERPAPTATAQHPLSPPYARIQRLMERAGHGEKSNLHVQILWWSDVTGVGRLWFGQDGGIGDPPMVKLRKKTEGGAVPTRQYHAKRPNSPIL